MKNIFSNHEKTGSFIKLAFPAATIIMIIVLLLGEKLLPENVDSYKYSKMLSDDWTLIHSDGSRDNIGSISGIRYLVPDPGHPLTLEYRLDDDIPVGTFMCVRSSSQAVYVSIDGTPRVEYDNAKIRKWGTSNVSRYVFVPLDDTDGGRTLRIEYKGKGLYGGRVTPIYIGTLDSLWYILIQKDGFAMLLEVMLVIIGLIMLVICEIVYIRRKYRMSLVWLALTMLNTAVYLLCYSLSRQLLFPNVTIMYDFGFAFAVMTWISYLLYLNEFQKGRYHKHYTHLIILMSLMILLSLPLILLSVVDSMKICLAYIPLYLLVVGTILAGIVKDIRAGLFREYRSIGILVAILIPMQVLLLLSVFGFIPVSFDMPYCLMMLVILCTDVFKEVNMLIEEKAKAARAESANEAKSAFLANMSHEIRTPINSIMGMNEMILRESDNPEILGYANTISNSGNFLLGIINDILDFSKIEAGKMEIIPIEYTTREMITELTNILSERAANKSLHANKNISESIPSKLCGDVVRVKQIIINIISNACKYTREGSVSISMSWETVNETEGLKTVVADTGIGMKPEDCRKLFDKFTRLEEKRNSSVEGTGLGMSIVKYLVDAMHGEINVDSVYGEGTTISIFLPQEVVSREPIGNPELQKAAPVRKKYCPKFTAPEAEVLVVDDVNLNLAVFKALLKNTLVRVDMADSGNTCLEMCNSKKYDVIYMDHMMPGMDGEEAMHALRNSNGSNKDTPIIVLTANAIAGSREQYLDMGFDSYLSKPVKPAALEQSLIDFLPADKVVITEE